MARLYQLAARWNEIRDEITQCDGEMPPKIEDEFDALNAELPEKVDGICAIIREQMGFAELARAEAQRLGRLATSAENNVRRLKTYLQYHMESMGCRHVDGSKFKVSIANNPRPTVEYTGAVEDLPVEFLKIHTDVDKQALYDAWHDNKPVPRGVTVTRGRHLRIR